MIGPEERRAVLCLYEAGMSQREIAERLRFSRNSIRDIIENKGAMPASTRSDKIRIDPELLKRLYAECEGYKQRVFERLVEEEGIKVTYPTVTRILRELGIGKPSKGRCDRVPDEPGAEMQHDTTSYMVPVGGMRRKVIASLLYMRYSKLRYLKFYRAFNRFMMKCFFHEALTFWGYVAGLCIIDNTNLARLRGTGKNAVIVLEMETFARRYGFRFACHERNHANRKAGNERSFFTVETNFLPGRQFESLEDMNQKAFEWATVRMYHRPCSKTGLIPAKAFEHERAFLTPLSPHVPAPYRSYERPTDQYGYVAIDGNFYWVPGTDRLKLTVLEYGERVELYHHKELLVEYPLPPEGVKNERFSPPGFPKPRYKPHNRKRPTAQEEQKLRAIGQEVGEYLDFALKPKGIQRHRFVRELFALSNKISSALFILTVARGLKYRIKSIDTLQRIAVLYMKNDPDTTVPSVDVDDGLLHREAYLEGRLTDEPDFSPFEELLEDDDG